MKRKILYLIAFSIILLFLGVIEYYKSWNLQSKNIKIQTKQLLMLKTSITPIPTGSGNLSDMTSWSTYMFNHEFTIAYPPDWVVLPDKDNNGVDFQTAYFHQDDDFTMPYGNSTDVSYSIFGQTDASDMSLQNGDKFPDEQTQETNIVSNVTHLHIDGFPAVEFDYYPTDNTYFIKTRIVIQKGQKIYRFNAVYAEKSGKTLFEQMIKSIHFS